MNKDLIKTLRRLQNTFTEVLEDTGLTDMEPYVNGVWRGLEIAIQELSEEYSEQDCTDKCAENAQVPVKESEEILKYLKSKAVKVETEEDYDNLMKLIEDKTDWTWISGGNTPTSNSYHTLYGMVVEFCKDFGDFSTMWKNYEEDIPEKLIPLEEAFNLLSQLPDKEKTDD